MMDITKTERALTLKQPWLWAMLCVGKDVENRTRPLPQHLVGVPIALHAGKEVDLESFNVMVALARRPLMHDLHPGMILAVAVFGASVTTSKSPWFFGPYGYPVLELTVVEPVAHVGFHRGFWRLDEATRARLKPTRRPG